MKIIFTIDPESDRVEIDPRVIIELAETMEQEDRDSVLRQIGDFVALAQGNPDDELIRWAEVVALTEFTKMFYDVRGIEPDNADLMGTVKVLYDTLLDDVSEFDEEECELCDAFGNEPNAETRAAIEEAQSIMDDKGDWTDEDEEEEYSITDDPKWVNSDEAAEILGLTTTGALPYHNRKGRLGKAVKVGARFYWKRSKVEKLNRQRGGKRYGHVG